jgi:hypothetical protein
MTAPVDLYAHNIARNKLVIGFASTFKVPITLDSITDPTRTSVVALNQYRAVQRTKIKSLEKMVHRGFVMANILTELPSRRRVMPDPSHEPEGSQGPGPFLHLDSGDVVMCFCRDGSIRRALILCPARPTEIKAPDNRPALKFKVVWSKGRRWARRVSTVREVDIEAAYVTLPPEVHMAIDASWHDDPTVRMAKAAAGKDVIP